MGFLDGIKAAAKTIKAAQNSSGVIIGGANKGCYVSAVISEKLDKKTGAHIAEYIESPDTLKITKANGEDVKSFTSADVKSYKIIASTHLMMFIKINFRNGEVSTLKVATMTIENSTKGGTTTTTTIYTHDADNIVSVLAPCDVE